VIYTRVPEVLKEAADAYAHQRGRTLTSSVAELLERGLTAVSDEASIASLEDQVGELNAENSQLRSQLQAASTELAAVKTLASRATRPVGSCPKCGKPISGYDLLAVGQCSECKQGLANLIAPETRAPGLDQREFLMMIGALGAVVGLAILAGKG
jgi:hypothetical protein